MISVCVSTFNRAALLAEMLESFERELTRFPGIVTEFVILLNGCTDTSKQSLELWCSRLANCGVVAVVYENTPPLSCMESYRRAIGMAKNNYVWLFSDDDVVCENALDTIAQTIAANAKAQVISLNWQSYEYDLKTPVGRPRMNVSLAGPYPTLLAFGRSVGIMHMSFISSLIVHKERYLRSSVARHGQYIETNYQHVCILIDSFGEVPCHAVGELCVLNRLNYRLDQADRTPKPLAELVLAGIKGNLALLEAFAELRYPPDLIERHKSETVSNLRFYLFYMLLSISMEPSEWHRMREVLLSTYSRVPMVRWAARTEPFVPKAMINWLQNSRSVLRVLHRLTVRVNDGWKWLNSLFSSSRPKRNLASE